MRVYHFVAASFEDLVFIFIGIAVFGYDLLFGKAGFIFLILITTMIVVARFANIYALSYIINLQKKDRIKSIFKLFLTYSGLRGAMAFALAIESLSIFVNNDVGNYMLTITLFVALLNIFIQAPFLPWIIDKYESQLGKI